MKTKDRIAKSAMELFDRQGIEETSVAEICAHAMVSNGSFFHAFPNRQSLFRTLYLAALADYHEAMGMAVTPGDRAMEGIAALIRTHVEWVVGCAPQARFLFEQSSADWLNVPDIRQEQENENARFGEMLTRWRVPLVEQAILSNIDGKIFIAQIIGPAQIFCRSWLTGRTKVDPLSYCEDLTTCAQKALVTNSA